MKIAFLGSVVALGVTLALGLATGLAAAERAGDPLSGLPPPPDPPQGFFRMRGFALSDEAVQKVGLDLALPKDAADPARGTIMIGSWRYSLQDVRLRRPGGKAGKPSPVRSFRARLFALPALVSKDDAPAPVSAAATPATTGAADDARPAGRRARRGPAKPRVERAGELEVFTVERTYGVAPVEIIRGWARIGTRRWDLVGAPGKAKP
jgi:hypothetical protein